MQIGTTNYGRQRRKLHADLALKQGDLKVAVSRLERAVAADRPSQAARWQRDVEAIRAGIADAKRALAELEEGEG